MIIAGAGGLAKELISVLIKPSFNETLYFYDDVNEDNTLLFNKYKVLKNKEELKKEFSNDNRFFIGIGNPFNRMKIFNYFQTLGGLCCSCISNKSFIGEYNEINVGTIIMPGVTITSNVKIGKCSLININSSISHDSVIGEFVEIAPNATITGNCRIGDNSFLGAGCVILPNLNIGNNVVIGAGSVVTKHIPDNSVVVGVPGNIIKKTTK